MIKKFLIASAFAAIIFLNFFTCARAWGLFDATKRSSELLTWAVEFADRMPEEVTISTATLSAVETETRKPASSVLVDEEGTISGSQVLFGVQGGTSGKRYDITVTATLSDGQVLQDVVRMFVNDK